MQTAEQTQALAQVKRLADARKYLQSAAVKHVVLTVRREKEVRRGS